MSGDDLIGPRLHRVTPHQQRRPNAAAADAVHQCRVVGAARPHLEGVVALGPQRRCRKLLHLLLLGSSRDAAQNDIHAVVLPLRHGKAFL